MKGKMPVISLSMPEPYLKGLDELVKDKLHPNRAEAIRMAVRDLLKSFGKFTYASLVTEESSAVSEPTMKKEVKGMFEEEKKEEEEEEKEEKKEEED